MNPSSTNQPVHLYLLAGQSNMDGMGDVSELPATLNRRQEGTLIYQPDKRDDGQPCLDQGAWRTLRPGHGYGYTTTGSGSRERSQFGIELTFAERLGELRPHQKIALFKYAKGGSSLHPSTPDSWGCWSPDDPDTIRPNQWNHYSFHYHRAIELWNPEAGKLIPAGLIWHQGESDAAYTASIANAYPENLTRIIRSMRTLTGKSNLPVAIGRISRNESGQLQHLLPHATTIQQAQQEFAKSDPHAVLVNPPEAHGWIDFWHYDSQTYLELGKRFADAILSIQPAE